MCEWCWGHDAYKPGPAALAAEAASGCELAKPPSTDIIQHILERALIRRHALHAGPLTPLDPEKANFLSTMPSSRPSMPSVIDRSCRPGRYSCQPGRNPWPREPLDEAGPNSADFGANSAEVAQSWPKLGQVWSKLGRDRKRAKLCRTRTKFARHRNNLRASRQMSVKFGQHVEDIDRHWPTFGQVRPEFQPNTREISRSIIVPKLATTSPKKTATYAPLPTLSGTRNLALKR